VVKRIAAVLIMGVIGLAPVVGTAPFAGAATDVPIGVAPYSGADPSLTRAPYVTDLTQTSAAVTWATAASAGSTPGTLTWGTGTNCTANTVPVPQSLPSLVPASASPSSATGRQFTVGSTSEFQSTVQVSGLQAGRTYCYRIFSGGTPAVDLLGSNASPSFTTLDRVNLSSTSPVTFDVVGDLGETNYSSGTDFANYLNTDQAAIDSLIGQSASAAGARFVVTAGDVAYSGGTETNYGDLQQTGSEVSDIFGPSDWPLTGGLPTFGVVGNHGQNVDSLRVWPESTSAANSSGTYGYASYPPVPADGVGTSTEPAAWYAISTGNVRIYVLDASWADGNVGTSNLYQVDYDEHWTPASPEYQWLAADLASHPGGVKMAVFHFPLRSDNSTQGSDPLLQNSTANPNATTSLEALLAGNGVSVAFNGHAHTYQRITPRQAGQITNYVTGGGGGVLEPVTQGGTCTSLLTTEDIYALGWSPSGAGPTAGTGSSCGPGTSTPQSAADVYNFLEVKVSGTTVTVTPVNAAGRSFDIQTYTPTSVTANPSTPANVTATATSSSTIQVNWNASNETGGAIASYAVYRNVNGGSYSLLAKVASPATTYTDNTADPGAQYAYRITATDNGSPPQTSTAGTSNKVATPSAPGVVTATATSAASVDLQWTASSEAGNGTIASYQIGRDGVPLGSVTGTTTYTDETVQPGTTYTYSVTAIDGTGAPSTPTSSNPVTTPGPPSLPFSGPPLGPVVNTCTNRLPAGSVVGAAAVPDGSGYYEVDAQGDVAAFGGAVCYGSLTGTRLNRPIVGMAADPATGGYWLVASDGGIFAFGGAPFFGSTGNIHLNQPIVGMTGALSGDGYWLVASDGGIFAFGGAPFFGSTGSIRLNKPVVGMAVDPATGGYWLVASDGGIFAFGGAPFLGSTGNLRLNKPVVGMTPLADGSGYRLIASDGGVFTFDAPFLGSTGSIHLNRPIIDGLDDPVGDGYWLIASDGGVFSFNAPFLGSAA
jgi:Calcineurin-like phosphoesterase/Fibronectin type III domain